VSKRDGKVNAHDCELDVKADHLVHGRFPILRFDVGAAIGQEHDLARPCFLLSEMLVLGLDRNNQGIDCC